MSRRNSARKRNRRDTHVIATRSVPVLNNINRNFSSPYDPTDLLRQFEDRRTWTPEVVRPIGSLRARPRLRVVENDPNVNVGRARSGFVNTYDPVPTKVGFDRPDDVLVCIRRTIRKHVLHALGKTGKSGQKKPKFNELSKISCRRRK